MFKVIFLLIGDVVILFASLLSALFLRYYPDLNRTSVDLHLTSFTLIFPLWLILFGAFGLYDVRFMKNSKLFLYRLLHAMASGMVLAIVLFYLIPYFEIEPRRNLIVIAVTATILLFSWRYIFNLAVIRAPASRLLFFGTDDDTVALADYLLKNPQFGQKPIGLISHGERMLPPLPLPVFQLNPHALAHIVTDNRADTIVISPDLKKDANLTQIIFQMIQRGIGVIEFIKLHEMTTGKVPLRFIGEFWFLENLANTRKGGYEFFKRLADVFLAVILFVLFILLLPFIAIAIQFESEGPIFFRQNRVGRRGSIFQLIKFRSMVQGADKMGGLKGENRDPRLTRVGAFLRKSYLDELPQILNILNGKMSLVGPRPERPEYVEILKEKIPFYETRLLIPPGLTGWAQINMENDASVEDAPKKMQYDLYYIKNRSFVLDLLIILRTISTLLRRQGR